MSCLPLFSFSPSMPTVFRPTGGSPISKPDGQRRETLSTAYKNTTPPTDLYDKLSQVSVSHRRVDSFEWVMHKSAPNTPSMSNDQVESFSPLPDRLVMSAPLPVRNEQWSIDPMSRAGQRQQGYFTWWSSPSVTNGNGYTVIPGDEENDELYEAPIRDSRNDSSESRAVGSRISQESRSSAVFPRSDRSWPPQELNALGIVLPATPPPSPPTSQVFTASDPCVEHEITSRTSTPRLQKRVTFSPVIDEVKLDSSTGLSEQSVPSWGNYLPSSFLVARPTLPRTSSKPVTQVKTCVRPILRRSTCSETLPASNTEMVRFSPGKEAMDESNAAISIPTQRLSIPRLPDRRSSSRDQDHLDKAFVSLLQITQTPSLQRCDSLPSDPAESYGSRCVQP